METVDTAFESLNLVLFENKNLGTIGVPLSSIKTHLWPSFDQFHRLFYQSRGQFWVPIVPQWYPKFFSGKVWCLSFLMPCRTHAQDVLFDLQNILKSGNINFHAKIAQNLQIFKHCTNRSRSHMHACNTGFGSPEHILFISEISGYHWGTVRTQEIQFSILFRNLPKLDRLNPQMEFYRKIWYPSGTQNFIFKKYKV